MEDNDAQLQLKKRARRRLVGAVAFASLVAIVLPVIMDNEPRQPVQDVEIRIPGQDEKPFAPRFAAPAERPAEKPAARAETPPAPVPTSEARPASRPEASPATVTETRPEAKPLGAPTARVVEVVRDKGDKTEKNDKAGKPAEKAPEKPAAKPEKPVEKPAAKPEKPADKPAEKDKDKEKAKNEEAKRAAALLGGQAAESKPAAKGGEFVILIGAFANEDNVRNLRSKLGEQGVKSYTEPLDSPQGRKTRLRAGPFPNREAADKALDKMRRIGVSGVVAAKQ